MFLIAIVAYIFVDVCYNLTIGMSIDLYFYEQAGIIDIYTMSSNAIILFLIFFLIIALGNLVLVIKPAISKKSLSDALIKGFLLGIVAYATFALPSAWSIQKYPQTLALIYILGVGIFSLFTSVVTTFIGLKIYK